MNGTFSTLVKALFCAAFCLAAVNLSAADGTTTPPTTPPAGGGGGRTFDPAARRAQFEERLKTELGSTEDEWKALQPKLDALVAAAFANRGGGGRRGGPNAAAATDDPNRPEAAKKSDALRTLLENKEADPKAITAALKELRDARATAKESLKKLQDGMKELLTARQEAVLVMNGLLD